MNRSARLRAVRSLLALLIVAGITVFFRDALPRVNQTTVALSFLLAILAVSAVWGMTVSVLMSIAAILALNYFFLPPVGAFTIADPQNWVALVAFLAVGVIASQLSSAAQERARDAVDRRNEVTRLFDLSRDVLLTGDNPGAIETLARHIARRFEIATLAICVPTANGWARHQGGEEAIEPPPEQLALALAR